MFQIRKFKLMRPFFGWIWALKPDFIGTYCHFLEQVSDFIALLPHEGGELTGSNSLYFDSIGLSFWRLRSIACQVACHPCRLQLANLLPQMKDIRHENLARQVSKKSLNLVLKSLPSR